MQHASRPAELLWDEREEYGCFVGWIPPRRIDALPMLCFAAIGLAVPAFYFGTGLINQRGVPSWMPLPMTLVGLGFLYHGLCLLLNRATFTIANGRFTFRTGPIPTLAASVSLPTAEIVAFRASDREVRGKRGPVRLWDVAVETRDGAAHRVKLSSPYESEASWIAQRLEAVRRGSAVDDDDPWTPIEHHEDILRWKNTNAFGLAEASHALRELGFFREHASASLAELVPRLARQYEARWEQSFDMSDPLREVRLAALDAERVCWNGDVARWKERFTDLAFAEVEVTGAECVVAVASIDELTKRRWPLRVS